MELKVGSMVIINDELQIQYIGKRGTKAVLKINGDRDKWKISKVKQDVSKKE